MSESDNRPDSGSYDGKDDFYLSPFSLPPTVSIIIRWILALFLFVILLFISFIVDDFLDNDSEPPIQQFTVVLISFIAVLFYLISKWNKENNNNSLTRPFYIIGLGCLLLASLLISNKCINYSKIPAKILENFLFLILPSICAILTPLLFSKKVRNYEFVALFIPLYICIITYIFNRYGNEWCFYNLFDLVLGSSLLIRGSYQKRPLLTYVGWIYLVTWGLLKIFEFSLPEELAGLYSVWTLVAMIPAMIFAGWKSTRQIQLPSS